MSIRAHRHLVGGGVMPQNINSVVLVGNLTRDPELRHTPSGTAVTTLRIAVNDRVKRGEEWVGRRRTTSTSPSGAARRENCAQYLAKGRPVGVAGQARPGVSGTPRTAPSASRSRSSPTTSSSSAVAATAAAAAAAVRARGRGCVDVPLLDFSSSPRPTTTSRSRRRR